MLRCAPWSFATVMTLCGCALRSLQVPIPSDVARVRAEYYTAEYNHEDDVGFVSATSDYFAAAVTIEELLAVRVMWCCGCHLCTVRAGVYLPVRLHCEACPCSG